MKIEFGHLAPKGFQWGTSGRMSSNTVHLAVSEPYAVQAICEVGLWGTAEYTSGTVCPKCARKAGLKAVADLEFDTDATHLTTT